MKKLFVLFSFILFFVSFSNAQKVVSLYDLNFVSQDSLLKMDQLQTSASLTLDDSKYYRLKNSSGATINDGDTISVTGVVIVKPRILTYTLSRYNIFIQDTAGKVWCGLNVLTGDTSTQAQGTYITALDTGYVVTITGRVQEYGSQPNSLTEMFAYDPIYYTTVNQIQFLGAGGKRPDPVEVKISDFAQGSIASNKVMFSTGEKYENMYVIIRDVTVSSIDGSGSGRFNIMDANGNEMGMYDGSQWYSLRGFKNSSSKYAPPPVGTKLAYIRGVIIPQLNAYNIMPLYPSKDQQTSSTYPGDIRIDKLAPVIANIKRAPIVVTPNDDVLASAIFSDNNTGGKIDSAFFNYKIGTNPLVTIKLNSGDTSYTIPKQADGTLVKYFFSAYNNLGLKGISPDTSKSWAFYYVKAKALNVYDVRYTPFNDGRSPYFGGTVTVAGVVSADTSDIPGATGTPKVYFQVSTGGPWSGINLYGSSTYAPEMKKVKRGDSIIVTGKVDEYSGRTEIVISAPITIVSSGTTVNPTSVSISGSGSLSYQLNNQPVHGTRTFEQWEGALIKISNPYVTNLNADGPTGHYGEWFISSAMTGSSSTYGLRVNDDGAYNYYFDADSINYTIARGKPVNGMLLPLNTKIGTITGVLDYVNSAYKLEPRKNDDIVGITNSVTQISSVPESYSISQNYPNPFNPTTVIEYTVPATSKIEINLYNTLGQLVKTLVNQNHLAGKYQLTVNAGSLASGLYFYQIKAENFVKTMKMVLVK